MFKKIVISSFVLLIGILLLSFTGDSKPNYSKSDSWAALPWINDEGDKVPKKSSLKNNQDSALVDVFYIHPTTYYNIYNTNANLLNRALNKITDETAVRLQASVFNEGGKIYAPRYRQAALQNFFRKDQKRSIDAFEIAYEDVKAAFEFYLKNYNKGRPIIIAGHSQGSMHGERLLKEFFDMKPLKDKLVAGYLIGYGISPKTFKNIPVCNSATQIGCVLSFNTFGWESMPKNNLYQDAICVNPISWKSDEIFIDKKKHKGAVPKSFDRIDSELVGCKCHKGVLWITDPGKADYMFMAGKNYHIFDYNLFYIDIRENVSQRVLAYFNRK
jgi:hypothetical protein